MKKYLVKIYKMFFTNTQNNDFNQTVGLFKNTYSSFKHAKKLDEKVALLQKMREHHGKLLILLHGFEHKQMETSDLNTLILQDCSIMYSYVQYVTRLICKCEKRLVPLLESGTASISIGTETPTLSISLSKSSVSSPVPSRLQRSSLDSRRQTIASILEAKSTGKQPASPTVLVSPVGSPSVHSDEERLTEMLDKLNTEEASHIISQSKSKLQPSSKASLVSAFTESEHDTTKPYTLLYVYADWCPVCGRFKNTWEELVQKYSSGFNYTAIDGDAEDTQHILNTLNVKGYPTLYVLKGNNIKEVPNVSSKNANNLYEEINNTVRSM